MEGNFLWGGEDGGRKISWGKWDHVCLPKEKGGLGIKDIALLNDALLTKWKLKMMNIEGGLWYDVSISKYQVGNYFGLLELYISNLLGGRTLGRVVGVIIFWGGLVHIWTHCWLGDEKLDYN